MRIGGGMEAMVGSTLEVAAEHIARAADRPYEDVLAAVREQFLVNLADELRPLQRLKMKWDDES